MSVSLRIGIIGGGGWLGGALAGSIIDAGLVDLEIFASPIAASSRAASRTPPGLRIIRRLPTAPT